MPDILRVTLPDAYMCSPSKGQTRQMAPKRRLEDSTDSSSDGSAPELPHAAAVHSFLRPGDQLASRTASRRFLESLDALYPDCGGLANTLHSDCSVYVLETDDAGATRERFPRQARTRGRRRTLDAAPRRGAIAAFTKRPFCTRRNLRAISTTTAGSRSSPTKAVGRTRYACGGATAIFKHW